MAYARCLTPFCALFLALPGCATNARSGAAGANAYFAAVDLAFDGYAGRPADVDLDPGDGYGIGTWVELPAENAAGTAVTLLAEYFVTEHEEVRSRTRSDLHLATLSGAVQPWWIGGERFGFGPRLCAGSGFLVIDHDSLAANDDEGLVVSFGLDVEVRAFRHLAMLIGGRFLWVGYPGDTLASGAVLRAGGGFRF